MLRNTDFHRFFSLLGVFGGGFIRCFATLIFTDFSSLCSGFLDTDLTDASQRRFSQIFLLCLGFLDTDLTDALQCGFFGIFFVLLGVFFGVFLGFLVLDGCGFFLGLFLYFLFCFFKKCVFRR